MLSAGCTPRLNKFAGSDHEANAYSIVFAGAKAPGGQIIGESDRDGGYVFSEACTPEDYATSIFEKLGVDRTTPLFTSAIPIWDIFGLMMRISERASQSKTQAS